MNKLRSPIHGLSFIIIVWGALACSAGGEGAGTGKGGSNAAGAGGSTGVAGSGLAGRGVAGSDPGVAGSGGTGDSGPAGAPGVAGSDGTGGAVGVGGSSPAGAPGTGGTSGGGAPGLGGNAVAGAAGAAGTPGAGGAAPVVEPKLITSANNNFWKVGTVTEVTNGTADVTVNDSSAQQTWNGMGGTFNEQGWNVLSLLSATERDRAIKLLFDANEGAKLSYGRVPIGASDYAMDRYTLNETAGDTAMANFSIERDKQKLIPYIQAALAVRPDLHLWGSPWTPPTWMKQAPFTYTNGALNYDGGHMKEDATTLQAFATYLAKFVEEYAKIGLKIEAIHPQNEPGYETRYPSCLWTSGGFAKFIGQYLGPTFASRNVTADIYVGTMSNNDTDPTIINAVTGDATANKYVKGFGLQWNLLDYVDGLRSRNLPIVQTEHKCGNYPWNPDGLPTFNPNTAANDYAYGVESWGYLKKWIQSGVNVYSAWNMVLDTAGKNLDSMRPWPQNALLNVNTSSKTLIITPAYYVFRHVSQYVDPGAKVVGTTGGDALAFKNPDGTIVAVIYNAGGAKNAIVQIAGKKLQFAMPSNGWATVNWK
jgi:glucosylceramidase